MLQYLFSPAEIDGKPAAIRIEYTLHFVPKTEAADGGAADADAGAVDAAPPPPPPPPDVLLVVGRLREKGTRNPLPGAEVTVILRTAEGKDKTGMVVGGTDAEGRFEVKGQPRSAMRLMVSEPRHEPCIRDLVAFELTGDKPFEVDCLVPKGGAPSYETTVRARKPPPAVTRYELSQPELKVVPGTFGDPLRVVQNLPGVARTPFGLGALVIRGASPNDSGIYVEGHKIPLLYHFLVGPGVLAPELIDRIDFFPGNFGVTYGRVTAGIVDVGIKTTPVAAAARDRRRQLSACGGVRRGAAGRQVVGVALGAAVVRRCAAAAGAARQPGDGGARLLGLPGRRQPRPAGRPAVDLRVRKQRHAEGGGQRSPPGQHRSRRRDRFSQGVRGLDAGARQLDQQAVARATATSASASASVRSGSTARPTCSRCATICRGR